jgi:hypothetical protein
MDLTVHYADESNRPHERMDIAVELGKTTAVELVIIWCEIKQVDPNVVRGAIGFINNNTQGINSRYYNFKGCCCKKSQDIFFVSKVLPRFPHQNLLQHLDVETEMVTNEIGTKKKKQVIQQ